MEKSWNCISQNMWQKSLDFHLCSIINITQRKRSCADMKHCYGTRFWCAHQKPVLLLPPDVSLESDFLLLSLSYQVEMFDVAQIVQKKLNTFPFPFF